MEIQDQNLDTFLKLLTWIAKFSYRKSVPTYNALINALLFLGAKRVFSVVISLLA